MPLMEFLQISLRKIPLEKLRGVQAFHAVSLKFTEPIAKLRQVILIIPDGANDDAVKAKEGFHGSLIPNDRRDSDPARAKRVCSDDAISGKLGILRAREER